MILPLNTTCNDLDISVVTGSLHCGSAHLPPCSCWHCAEAVRWTWDIRYLTALASIWSRQIRFVHVYALFSCRSLALASHPELKSSRTELEAPYHRQAKHPCRCPPAGPRKCDQPCTSTVAFERGRPPLYTAHYVCGALNRAPARDLHCTNLLLSKHI